VTALLEPPARLVRRSRGRDIWAWLDALGDLSRSRPADELSSRARNPRPALPLDGRRGGRTLDLGVLAAAGVRVTGRLEGFTGTHALLGGALDANVADADARLRHLLQRIDDHIASRPDADAFPPPARIAPVRVPAPPRAIDLGRERIATIVWATGHRRHFPYLRIPAVVSEAGDVSHDRGRTAVPGLYVLGMRWQSRMTSHSIGGVGHDAAFLAAEIAGNGATLRAAA